MDQNRQSAREAGNDVLQGEADEDRLFGGGGHDLLQGGSEDDYLLGEGEMTPKEMLATTC